MRLEAWQEHDMDEEFSIGSGMPSSTSRVISQGQLTEIDALGKKVLWTGDMDTRSSPNVSGALPVPCDILCLEGTYGGKYHPDRSEEEERFVESTRRRLPRRCGNHSPSLGRARM